jgi:hypothetical protein
MKLSAITTLLIIFVCSTLSAQEKTSSRLHQVGITFSNLNSFGAIYKTGNDKTLFRLSLLSLGYVNSNTFGRDQDSVEYKTSQLAAGIRFGFEKHIPVNKEFCFLAGAEFGFEYRRVNMPGYSGNDNKRIDWTITPGIYLLLGAEYVLKNHWVFGAEITPGVWFDYGKSTTTTNGDISTEITNQVFNAGFKSNSAALSVAYRF